MVKLTTEDFIRKARTVHGEKYDYSKVEYVNTHIKVIIVCPKHGEFKQEPNEHSNGRGGGCPKCADIINGLNHRNTTENFIRKARLVHGEKYDYSKTIYVKTNKKVIIICPEHNEFNQTPNDHLNGRGCQKCKGRNRNTNDFITDAKKIHGNKYNYALANYIDCKTFIKIICLKHGEFEQKPTMHLSGQGCLQCSNEKKGQSQKLTTEDFIRKARAVHGEKYDYSKVEYVNNQTPVIIICPTHGEFEQTPSNHLSNHGCRKCIGNYNLTTEEFIKKAKEVHGEKYDYSKVEYVKSNKKVTIICFEHGEFEQTPISHLHGCECNKCVGNYNSTTEDFIRKAIEVHGNKYDYSKVNYIKSVKKVTIICFEHGEFEQQPSNHLQGQGCGKCIGQGFTYISLDELKKIIQPLGIKTKDEYLKWWDDNKKYCQEIGIPKYPNEHYIK